MMKNLRHLRNLRDKKRPKKNLCISVKSVGLFPLSGGIFSSWECFVPQISQIYTDFF